MCKTIGSSAPAEEGKAGSCFAEVGPTVPPLPRLSGRNVPSDLALSGSLQWLRANPGHAGFLAVYQGHELAQRD